MTVGYSLCCTPFLLPPPFRPPLRRPTFLSSSLARAALLSVPLFPSISGKRTREREREEKRIQRWNVRWPYRFIALQSRAALPIAGKFKPCHRAGQFFLDELCLLGDRPRSRKSRPPPFSPIRVYCFRDRNGRFLFSSIPKCDLVLFLLVEGNRPDCKLPGNDILCAPFESNRVTRVSIVFINPQSLLYLVFSILHSYNNRTKERIEETLHTP